MQWIVDAKCKILIMREMIYQPEEVGCVGRRRTLVLRAAVAPHLHLLILSKAWVMVRR